MYAIPPSPVLESLQNGRRALLAVASPGEAAAVLRGLGAAGGLEPWVRREIGPRFAVILTGVGKANAAGGVVRGLLPTDSAVVSLGLAGALPGSGLGVGQALAADACILADEGVATPERFLSLSEVGFPSVEGAGERLEADSGWTAALRGLAGASGAVATVSTCSGTDGLAEAIARRTGALAEDMESAAVALCARRLGVPFACLRVISNRTGDRDRQGWDVAGALAGLERLAAAL